MKYCNKTVALVLSFIILLGLCGCGEKKQNAVKELPQLTGNICDTKQVLKTENENVIFTLYGENGNISLTEKHTGRVWNSNPETGYTDPYASGISKTNMFSQLVVEYKSEKKGMQTTNSYVSSIRKNNYKIYKTDGGFRIEYTFNEGFTIPVNYHLTENGFSADILYEYISETEENQIHTINLLPYFGTANAQNSGYLFIPDGSGALINFNNGKSQAAIYEEPVYGSDEALPCDYETTRTEQIYIPIIGMKRDNGAFIATVTQGDGDVYIKALVSGQETDFNTVSYKAVYRAVENLSVLNGSLGTAGLVLYGAQNPVDNECFCVEYSFIQEENPDYNSMAKVFRRKLIADGELNASGDSASLYADFYGGVLKNKTFAGFQYTGTEALTTFEQAQELLKKLSDGGCKKIILGYKNYSKSCFNETVRTNLTPSSDLGGKKGYKKLKEYTENNGIELYSFADFYSFKKSGEGFSKFFDVIKELDLAAAKIYPKKINTNLPDTSADPYFLLSPSLFFDAAERLFDSAEKNGIDNIYLGDICSNLSGDYAVGGVKRSSAIENLRNALEIREANLMLSSPNKYLWKYADKMADIPLSSSQHRLFDCDVPFLQMLLKGSVAFAGNSLNLQNNSDDNLLKSVAFAQNLHYSFMADDASELQNTELISLYGLSDAALSDAAVEFEKFSKYYSFVEDAVIEAWYSHSQISETVFDNGCRVLVNFCENSEIFGNFEIPSRGYLVVKDGEILLKQGGTE